MNKRVIELSGAVSSAAFATVALSSILVACGGAPVKQVKVEEPQFKVIDAAPGGREAWLDNPNFYAEKEGLDVKTNYYYTGDAQSADKRMACEKAQGDAMDDIARQVSTFVDTTLARASSESSGADTTGISENSASQTQTSELSSQLSKTLVTGIDKKKQYWEQRDYSQVGGAKSIYHCWVLAEIGKQKVQELVAKAETIRFDQDPNLKTKVEGKVTDIQSEFDKYQHGH